MKQKKMHKTPAENWYNSQDMFAIMWDYKRGSGGKFVIGTLYTGIILDAEFNSREDAGQWCYETYGGVDNLWKSKTATTIR